MDLKRILVVANETKPRALQAVARLKPWCQARRIELAAVEGTPPRDDEGAIVLSLGGDGTVLRAAALFERSAIPILGINVGSLGFLTQAPLEGLEDALELVLADEYSVEERMRLAYVADGTRGTVLNELVIAGRGDAGFCEVDLMWGDGHVAQFPGDGLIVATATGSTAYSLSAGGPIIVPPAACILATPHASHRLGLRPIVFPPDEVLKVRVKTGVRLVADGDLVRPFEAGSDIHIRRAPTPTRLVRLNSAMPFFGVLNEKLNWAGA